MSDDTTDTEIGRAWRELSELVAKHGGMVTVSHWQRPDGDMHHRVSAHDFRELDRKFDETSPDLAEALDRVRIRLESAATPTLHLVRNIP